MTNFQVVGEVYFVPYVGGHVVEEYGSLSFIALLHVTFGKTGNEGWKNNFSNIFLKKNFFKCMNFHIFDSFFFRKNKIIMFQFE